MNANPTIHQPSVLCACISFPRGSPATRSIQDGRAAITIASVIRIHVTTPEITQTWCRTSRLVSMKGKK